MMYASLRSATSSELLRADVVDVSLDSEWRFLKLEKRKRLFELGEAFGESQLASCADIC